MRDLSSKHPQVGSIRKVLLVEDDASVVASLRLFLKTDFEVHSASTVASGVNLFKSLQPDLVVLDLRLSDGEGLDVLRGIRRINRTAPVIVLTGYASMKTAEESLRLGASDYLHKPFDGYELKSRINQLTAGVSARRSLADEETLSVSVPVAQISELERKAQASSMFLHDAANPVMTALNAAQFLCDAMDAEPGKFNKAMHDAGDLLSGSMAFVTGLFEQSRSIERLRRLEASPVAIHRIVDIAVKMVRDEAKEKEIIVAAHLQNREAKICVNCFALARVLFNLLTNAIHAVEAHSGRVALRADLVDGHVEFSVLDNGPGVSTEIMERIFEPYFTTKAEGTGLGLHICKLLVENMHGTLTVRNQPDQGCCFTIRIPCDL